ncbi:Putative NAD(P)H nitroreductase YdjA [Frondihabitans sp. 762G35]|uniref:nitroreductase family protein n=1 Tax=Frondihabitans sp. 762G35 TaxID=1446794 RepID=UPI000D1FFEBF|nr:nitroreductase family protein [Frondihabitans sp. 762G35]ARC55939.1 Putative NAD(P)H nitroreductase YdjA [Frondihabitans sp. 762G35]
MTLAYPARDAVLRRRSRARVTAEAPSSDELLSLVEAAATVADHSGLRPWRLIEIRGESRSVVGRAIAAAGGATGEAAELLAQKPLRAPLLVGVVLSPRESRKVPEWEQESVASGVAHVLSLLLDEAGWGVMWRTGIWTRSAEVHAAHGLESGEKLLGWLYVGGIDPYHEVEPRKTFDAAQYVKTL